MYFYLTPSSEKGLLGSVIKTIASFCSRELSFTVPTRGEDLLLIILPSIDGCVLRTAGLPWNPALSRVVLQLAVPFQDWRDIDFCLGKAWGVLV